MKKNKAIQLIITSIFLLIPVLIYAQEIKSSTVSFRIDNMPEVIIPDTKAPEVTVLSPQMKKDGTFRTVEEKLNLIGEISDESEVKFISVNSDVREINAAGIFMSEIQLVPGENTIKMMAMDINNNMMEQQFVIDYQPPIVTLADRIINESKYYGLIIGVDKYDDPEIPDLDNPNNDAERLHKALSSNYLFDEENLLLIKNATRSDIMEGFEKLGNKITPEDNLLIFYAGHGWWDENANIGFWLPSDADANVKTNWFRNSTLVDYLKEIDTKHTLLITDACFGGSIFKTRSAFPNKDKAYEKLYDLPSRKAMTSGTLTEVPDRSSFTKYLIDRLVENEEEYLSSEQLFSSFRIAVINNSDAIPQFGEIGNVGDEGGDFIFIKRMK
ncbi:caspase family protein [Bacteroidota bacterium]